MKDVLDELLLLQVRQIVTTFTTACGHSRAWYYRVCRGAASISQREIAQLRTLLAKTKPQSAIALLREHHSVRLKRAVDRAELAQIMNTSRQTVSIWEKLPNPPQGRVDAVAAALKLLS